MRTVAREVCGDTRLGISVGEAYYPGDGLDAEDLLAGADLRMYKTKQEHKSPRHYWRSSDQTIAEKRPETKMVAVN